MIIIDDNKNVAVQSEVETTTPTNSPQVEAPATTKEQTDQPQVDQPKEGLEQVSDGEDKQAKDSREYQIQRLAEENRRLKQERKGPSAFDAFKSQGAPQQVDINTYTDEYGNVNWQGYNQAVNSHIQQVASVQAQQAVEERWDEQNARSKHPDLFDDPDTEKEMAAMWLWEKTQGNSVTVSDIADRFSKRYKKDVTQAEKRGRELMLEEVSEKEQAGMSAPTQTSASARRELSAEDEAVLEQRTREGDADAIVARLSRVPWANK